MLPVSWSTGSHVAGYEILSPLGTGGMGEVYRARDQRLQRDVALKVVHAALLRDPERRARFEREARVLASLSHPNIGAIHGIEDLTAADGQRSPVLVLEFVDGRTLADRIAAGPVPVDEAIGIALQVAEAVEAAHERGIIHRDLKPANVQLTPDGTVKVLDFGLAKALDTEASGSLASPAQSPTLTSASTQMGVIMGTAAYMAPEQARGRTVDRRADIWAFGALLFELLSGRRAFPGDTISDTLAAILTTEPDWSALPPETPQPVQSLIRRCLDRDPRQRLQSIGEARIVLAGRPQFIATDAAVQRRSGISAAIAVAMVAGAVALTAAAAVWWPRDERAPVPRRLDVAVGAERTRTDSVPALSPDGSHLFYISDGRLWTRALSGFNSREVAGSEGATYPFWSPDGRQLAFVSGFKLWKVSVDGGEPQFVAPVPRDMVGTGDGAWTEVGNFVLVGSDAFGILEISGADGSSRELLPLDRQRDKDFHEISELPGGRGLLFTTHTMQSADAIELYADGQRHELLRLPGETLRSPVYDPSGYLLYGRDTNRRGVWAVRFSLDSLQIEGVPFLVDANGDSPSVARDGTLAMVRRSMEPAELLWIDRRGGIVPQGRLSGPVSNTDMWTMLRLSPDGEKLAVAVAGEGGDDLWLYDLSRRTSSPLSRGAQMVVWPTWMPDGRSVLFGGFAGGRVWSVHRVSATETSTPQRVLPEIAESQWPCAISPDGRWLLYTQRLKDGTSDLYIAPIDRPSETTPLMQTPVSEFEGQFSPDGRWLAYLSDESGPFELYVRRWPIGPDRVQLSNGGAAAPKWSADGRELVYRGSDALMSVQLTERDGELAPSVPRPLFALTDPALSTSFAVSRDSQRFLFARATGRDQISVITNWAQLMPR